MDHFDFLESGELRVFLDNLAEEVHVWELLKDIKGNIQTWKLVYVNPPTLKTWGKKSLEEIKGKTTDEIFGQGATEHYLPVVKKVMKENIPHSFIDYFPNLDKHFRFTTIPFINSFITTGIDITDLVKEKESILFDKKSLELLINERTVLLNDTVEKLQKSLAESQKLKEKLEHQAVRDYLTGVFNRRFMDEYIEHEIEREKRTSNVFCIIMFDIDYFKTVNDNYGHQFGDLILMNTGKYMLNHIRGGDIVCRYGGDEFLLLMPETQFLDSLKKAETIKKGLSNLTFEKNNIKINITVSMGVVQYPFHGQTMNELIKNADIALYKAKKNGRNRIEIPDE